MASPQAAPSAVTAQSSRQANAWKELGRNRRLLEFQAVVTGGPLGIGAVALIHAGLEDHVGATAAQLGAVATVVILARAITAVPAGAVIDRINPAKASLVSFTAMAIVAVFIASLLALDRLPFSILLVAAACEGVGIALALPANLTLQAAMTPVHLRAAAEVINSLRISIGVVLGVFLGVLAPTPAIGYALVALGWFAAGIGSWLVTRRVPVPERATAPIMSGLREASIRVWQRRPLRVAFINETAVRAFAPVALITLFVAEYQLEHRATDLLFAAAIGACIGTATLSFTSASTHIRLKLSGSLAVYVVTLAAGAAVLFSGASADADGAPHFVLVGLLTLACASLAFAVALGSSIVQQRVPDDMRGRAGGFSLLSRQLAQAASCALTVFIAARFGVQSALLLMAVALAAYICASRGFRSLIAVPEEGQAIATVIPQQRVSGPATHPTRARAVLSRSPRH